MDLRLTAGDLYLAAQAGIMRRISAIKAGRPEPYASPSGDLWGVDIEACIAEMLVARALDRAWVPYRARPGEIGADVSEAVQVRSTERAGGRLLLHPADRDDQVFVLVVGSGLGKRIAGWIRGADGKAAEFWRELDAQGNKLKAPCYFVPQSALASIDLLWALR